MPASRRVGDIPLCQKMNLTVAEASAYTGIGQSKIRELLKMENCPFLFQVGPGKILVRRRQFEEFIESRSSLDK